ncbi:MAG: glycosyltransferase family A protein [Woeseiaceae bacterium]|nr:glycosyltransferase family A protein [Woeseiaceae bacterium]
MPSVDFVIPAFNAAAHIEATLAAIFDQHVPPWLDVGIVVADAGSTDATADVVRRYADRAVRQVTAATGQNRAAARNAGAAASRADYLLLLDADCRLADADCLGVAAAAIAAGIGAGFGYTTGAGEDLLSRYQARLEQRRRTAGWTGWTTACCLVRRDLFERVGGYSTDYEHYGFEDRDFVCRLRAEAPGELHALPGLRAVHDGPRSLAEIRDKMYAAGRHTSGLFRDRFPDAYGELDYSRIDAATAAAPLRALLGIAAALEPALLPIADRAAASRRLPLAIGVPLVRLASAVAFYRGTRARDRAS